MAENSKVTVEERALLVHMGHLYVKTLERAIKNSRAPLLKEANEKLLEQANLVFAKFRALGIM